VSELLHPLPPDAGSGSVNDGPRWVRTAAVLTALFHKTGLLDETIARVREAIRSHPDPESLLRDA
jgi:hypothetical protein